MRVEACDVCHHYIKTVDMTKDGNAVPVVDEIATIAFERVGRRTRLLKNSNESAGHLDTAHPNQAIALSILPASQPPPRSRRAKIETG